MNDERAPKPGELFMFSDDLLLANEMEVLTVGAFRLGVEGMRNVTALGFTGRINQSTETRRINIALSPRDALELVELILDTMAGAQRRAAQDEPDVKP